jgi:hypothetical protein
VAAAWGAHGARQVTLPGILLDIVAYQLVGTPHRSLHLMALHRVLDGLVVGYLGLLYSLGARGLY